LAKAKEDVRKRSHKPLETEERGNERYFRMLNAMDKDSYARPHKHPNEACVESFRSLRGKAQVVFFNESGEITDIQPLDDETENEVQIPASAEKIIENGNISLNISRTSGSVESIYLTVEEKRVTHISKNFPEKSAYDVFTDEEAINEIINSEDISATILDLYHQGKIKVEANGFGNNIKLFFAKIFLNFA